MEFLRIENTTLSEIFVDSIGQSFNAGVIQDINPKKYSVIQESILGTTTDLNTLISSGDFKVYALEKELNPAEALRFLGSLNIMSVLKDQAAINLVTKVINFSGPSIFVSQDSTNEDQVNIAIGDRDDDFTGLVFYSSYAENGGANDEYLNNTIDNIVSNESPDPMLFNCQLVGITYSNSNQGADFEIQIRVAPAGSGNSDTTIYSWSVDNARIALNRNVALEDPPITVAKGDKVAVYFNDQGGNSDDVVVKLWWKVLSSPQGNVIENYSGDL